MEQQKQNFLRYAEGKFFIAGLALFGFFVVYILYYYLHDPATANKIMAMVLAEVFGGRTTGMTLGMQQHVPVFDAMLFSLLQDVIILYLCAPLVTIFYGRLNKEKFLGWLIERTKRKAQESRESSYFSKGFAYAAVFIFIWIPFYMTGTFVGFVIALLLGISVFRGLVLATVATLLGSVTWALAFQYIIETVRKVGEVIPTIIVLVILGGIILFNIHQFHTYLQEKKGKRK